MSDTLRFYVKDDPSRQIYRGQLHFRNGAAEWRELHSGGTLKLRLVGKEVVKIEEINYGFMLKAKGGLKDAESAALDLEFELSFPDKIVGTEDYDLKRDRMVSAVDCKVGHTMALGGVNSLLNSATVEATPILRSIPLLSAFFSQKTSNRTDKQMLVLVSPHIVGDMGKAGALSEQNKKIMDISEKSADERLKEKRPRRFFFF
jgi:type II secretory pathway component GspD/PulD (secretin)